MLVQPISQHNQVNFGKVYAKTKNFSAEQKEIYKLIMKEFEKSGATNKTYVDVYKIFGFDFILKPLGNNLLSLESTNNFSILKWLFQKNYTDKSLFHIGVYNKTATKYVLDDLGYNRPLFKFLNLDMEGLLP